MLTLNSVTLLKELIISRSFFYESFNLVPPYLVAYLTVPTMMESLRPKGFPDVSLP